MARLKFDAMFNPPASDDATVQALVRQVASLTESLQPLFRKQTTVKDNINADYKEVRIQSGTPVVVESDVLNIKGARVIYTGGFAITKEAIRLLGKNRIEITIEYQGSSGFNPMTIHIFGE